MVQTNPLEAVTIQPTRGKRTPAPFAGGLLT